MDLKTSATFFFSLEFISQIKETTLIKLRI